MYVRQAVSSRLVEEGSYNSTPPPSLAKLGHVGGGGQWPGAVFVSLVCYCGFDCQPFSVQRMVLRFLFFLSFFHIHAGKTRVYLYRDRYRRQGHILGRADTVSGPKRSLLPGASLDLLISVVPLYCCCCCRTGHSKSIEVRSTGSTRIKLMIALR
jgi:hypothetical protein